MKFPSLFRLPKHQQFHIAPRYYDPVKEEMEKRVENIRKEMEGVPVDIETGDRRFNFRKKKSSKLTANASMMQLIIAIGLVILLLGWLQYGNSFFYYLIWVIIPLYFFVRLRKNKRNR